MRRVYGCFVRLFGGEYQEVFDIILVTGLISIAIVLVSTTVLNPEFARWVGQNMGWLPAQTAPGAP